MVRRVANWPMNEREYWRRRMPSSVPHISKIGWSHPTKAWVGMWCSFGSSLPPLSYTLSSVKHPLLTTTQPSRYRQNLVEAHHRLLLLNATSKLSVPLHNPPILCRMTVSPPEWSGRFAYLSELPEDLKVPGVFGDLLDPGDRLDSALRSVMTRLPVSFFSNY